MKTPPAFLADSLEKLRRVRADFERQVAHLPPARRAALRRLMEATAQAGVLLGAFLAHLEGPPLSARGREQARELFHLLSEVHVAATDVPELAVALGEVRDRFRELL